MDNFPEIQRRRGQVNDWRAARIAGSTLHGQYAEHLVMEQAIAGDDLGVRQAMRPTAKIGHAAAQHAAADEANDDAAEERERQERSRMATLAALFAAREVEIAATSPNDESQDA